MNTLLSTVQLEHKLSPSSFEWCYHTHSILTRKSVECNQHTKRHQFLLDGVTIHTAYKHANRHIATISHNKTTPTWMVSLYTQEVNTLLSIVKLAHTITPSPSGWCHHTHSISTRKSVQCNQQKLHHDLRLDGVTIYTAYELANQYSTTSIHNTTTSPWIVLPYTQRSNSQISTVQPAGTRPPIPLGWCHYIHKRSIRNSVQCNQQTTPPTFGWCLHTHSMSHRSSTQCNQHTQHHQLQLDGVIIHKAYQLQTQLSATSTPNITISIWMVSQYTRHINTQLSTVQPTHTKPPRPFEWCHYIHKWMVSLYTQEVNTQLSTVQPAHTTPPLPFGWCHYVHKISSCYAEQRNQRTEHHQHLDGVTINTACHLVT